MLYVPLRPNTLWTSGSKLTQPRLLVALLELAVYPAEANRCVESFDGTPEFFLKNRSQIPADFAWFLANHCSNSLVDENAATVNSFRLSIHGVLQMSRFAALSLHSRIGVDAFNTRSMSSAGMPFCIVSGFKSASPSCMVVFLITLDHCLNGLIYRLAPLGCQLVVPGRAMKSLQTR